VRFSEGVKHGFQFVGAAPYLVVFGLVFDAFSKVPYRLQCDSRLVNGMVTVFRVTPRLYGGSLQECGRQIQLNFQELA